MYWHLHVFFFFYYYFASIQCWLPVSDRVNNFPPLPKFLRIKPCFYQNIDDEIPAPYQQLVRRVYTLWMCKFFLFFYTSHLCTVWNNSTHSHLMFLWSMSFTCLSLSAVYSGTLCMNVISCIAWWAGGGSATNFGFSLLWLILFSPCSYTCWFRPLYKAFRLVIQKSENHFWMLCVHHHTSVLKMINHTLSVRSGARCCF